MNSKPYTFTIATARGPVVERFQTQKDMDAFVCGWLRAAKVRPALLIVNAFDWRAAS